MSAKPGEVMNNAIMRRAALATWDVLGWTLATALVIGVRHDFSINEVEWQSVIRYWLLACVLMLGLGYATKFYRGRFLVGSFDEALGLAVHVGLVGMAGIGMSLFVNESVPRSIPVLAPPVALLLCAAGRWFYRAIRDKSDDLVAPADVHNALVYGAGEAGRQVLQLLRNERELKLRVVGFVDDNPGKRHLRILGVPVLGDGSRLEELAVAHEVDTVVLAVPQAAGQFIGQLQERVHEAGLELLLLPRVSELMGGRVQSNDLRRIEIEDVLGRHQVSTNLSDIAGYLSGKRVLITGAGGSIGSELARQVHKFGPATMVMLDRDESGLHAAQLGIFGHGLLDKSDTVLVDIRDLEALRKVFAEHRPEIVFHAAALKHLPMLERFPDEGWKTNVLGTLNLLRLSAEFDVEQFVNISTDKAADASSILGLTKRLAEQLTAWQAEQTGRPYISVRFGNVLGSRGSMLHTFNAQIAAGGPITITHPDVSRYFMTIPEACELVVQAGAIGHSGEVMVLEMGEPVRILDVAKRMIQLSGARGVDIVFTGLRQGEKLHEKLFGDEEHSRATRHPMIRAVEVAALDPVELDGPTDAMPSAWDHRTPGGR
ncbi:polysaccharide biosynthesis protein [Nocardioides pinisoli]|uniref:Polysaccharide biosynthesis protein n=1 Tax=Nocardioides pinisoli TaxID=2950279 RepID=A0ABT1KSD1_9ACTN|nr:nucleoside-diphosphate sugar epimerase/dehydratase [Nocardioides pinisoli]MCP3420647.1 polysaccharide biosynthesis protein [Nocardioides pinisoli]